MGMKHTSVELMAVFAGLFLLLSLTGSFIRNAQSKLLDPEVNVDPPETYIGQPVDVMAVIHVQDC